MRYLVGLGQEDVVRSVLQRVHVLRQSGVLELSSASGSLRLHFVAGLLYFSPDDALPPEIERAILTTDVEGCAGIARWIGANSVGKFRLEAATGSPSGLIGPFDTSTVIQYLSAQAMPELISPDAFVEGAQGFPGRQGLSSNGFGAEPAERLEPIDRPRPYISRSALDGSDSMPEGTRVTRHEVDSIRVDAAPVVWQRHFGLRCDPFALTPDPQFLFLSDAHREALAGLKLSLLEKRGLTILTGEVGTGKTTILYSLLGGLGSEVETAYLHNTTLSFDELLEEALRDLGIPIAGTGRLAMLRDLNDFLDRAGRQGKTVALAVDESQNLTDEAFEGLRLLLNYETYTSKLLQIVLVGQPELSDRLRSPSLRQIADRVAIRCHLRALSVDESRQYLEHRLKTSGATEPVFSKRAMSLIVRRSAGIPRRMNVLGHNSMLFAYGNGSRRVEREQVKEALRELRWTSVDRRRASIFESWRLRH